MGQQRHERLLHAVAVVSGASWELRKRRKGKKNLHTLFEVENADRQSVRTLLDPLEPAEFAPQYEWVWQQLARMGGLQPYQTSLGTRLIALDGMTYHSSSTIACDRCSTRRDHKGPSITTMQRCYP